MCRWWRSTMPMRWPRASPPRHESMEQLVRVWYLGDGIGYGRHPHNDGVWEAGHMVVTLDPKERYCGCGGIGHLEGIMGHRAMRLRFLDMEPEEVFVAARHGDQRAGEFVKLWHRALAAGTANSIHLDGPGRFYIAGPNADFVDLRAARRLHAGHGEDESAARQLLPDCAHQPRHGGDRRGRSQPGKVGQTPGFLCSCAIYYDFVHYQLYAPNRSLAVLSWPFLSLTVWVSVRPVHSQSKPKAAKAIAAATRQLRQRGLHQRRRDEDLSLLPGLRPARGPQPAIARFRYRGALRCQPPGGVGTEAGRQHDEDDRSAAAVPHAL